MGYLSNLSPTSLLSGVMTRRINMTLTPLQFKISTRNFNALLKSGTVRKIMLCYWWCNKCKWETLKNKQWIDRLLIECFWDACVIIKIGRTFHSFDRTYITVFFIWILFFEIYSCSKANMSNLMGGSVSLNQNQLPPDLKLTTKLPQFLAGLTLSCSTLELTPSLVEMLPFTFFCPILWSAKKLWRWIKNYSQVSRPVLTLNHEQKHY